MTEPTPREIRRSEKAEAAADRLLAEATQDGAVPNVGAMLEAAYVAGWNESVDDLKRMIDEAERG